MKTTLASIISPDQQALLLRCKAEAQSREGKQHHAKQQKSQTFKIQNTK